MKTILVPVDFSPVTDAVVTTATELARELSGRVVLLNVIQPPVILAEYAPLMEGIAEITAAGEKNASRELAKLEQKLADKYVSAESVVVTGAPGPAILAQADESSADYIVLGSHGHTALYDLLVGSTAHLVLLKAKCPVVIVPAGKTAEGRKAKSKAKATMT
jgi:nucleotide-binding universal stress UspA family protein